MNISEALLKMREGIGKTPIGHLTREVWVYMDKSYGHEKQHERMLLDLSHDKIDPRLYLISRGYVVYYTPTYEDLVADDWIFSDE